MRKDFSIDRQKVYLKNSSTLGFSSKTLRCGERFVFDDDGRDRLGLMIGHISACSSPDYSDIVGRIVTISLSVELDLFERLVRPSDVIRTIQDNEYDKSLEKVTEFLTLDAGKHDIHKLRAFVESGFATVAAFDARHPYTHLADYSKEG